MPKFLQTSGGTRKGRPHLNPPANCDLCDAPIQDTFYDANVGRHGRWGNLCPKCFSATGSMLGVGLGQEYTKEKAE